VRLRERVERASAGSSVSSVWHGPAEGNPKAAEDMVTPEAAYGQ